MKRIKMLLNGVLRIFSIAENLWQGKRAISVRPNAFAVLRLLVENAGPLVTKQQVLAMVWPGTFVGDAVLKDNIRQLRKLPHYWPETVAAHADGAKY